MIELKSYKYFSKKISYHYHLFSKNDYYYELVN